MMVQIELLKNQVLINEGETSDVLYILTSGELAVYKYDTIAKKNNLIGYIQAGEMVGEMSFLDSLPRSATVKANTDCQLKMMNRPSFDALLKSQDIFMQNLVNTLSDRLRKTNRKIHC